MAWTCYSCGTKNPKSADVCTSCGGTVAAPSSFYIHWIFGGAVFFFVFYMAGTLAGGVPRRGGGQPGRRDGAGGGQRGPEDGSAPWDSIDAVDPDAKTAARAVATEKAKAALSPALKGVLYWILPVVLFVLCGIIVGFISDGKTVFEPGIGSVLGQVGGFLLHMYVFETSTSWWFSPSGSCPASAWRSSAPGSERSSRSARSVPGVSPPDPFAPVSARSVLDTFCHKELSSVYEARLGEACDDHISTGCHSSTLFDLRVVRRTDGLVETPEPEGRRPPRRSLRPPGGCRSR